jgi:hypothetical protein
MGTTKKNRQKTAASSRDKEFDDIDKVIRAGESTRKDITEPTRAKLLSEMKAKAKTKVQTENKEEETETPINNVERF